MSYLVEETHTYSRGLRIFAVIATILTLGYMFPWAYAIFAGSEKVALVGWLNLLTGWTLIGWASALVLAMFS